MCSKRAAAVLFVGLAMLSQLIYVWLLSSHSLEVWEYETVSQNFLSGKGLSIRYLETDYRALLYPFYSLFCVTAYLLFGRSQRAMAFFQIGAFGGIAFIIYWIGKEVFSEKVGLLALLLVCLHPGLFIYATRKLHPLIFDTFLFSLFLLFILKIRRRTDLKESLLGGFLLGITLLSRSTIFLFAALAWGWLFKQWEFHWKKKLFYLSVFLLTTLTVLAPWMVRNAIVFGRFVPVTTTFGLQLWLGNNPNATGTPLTLSGEAILHQDKEFLEQLYKENELGQSGLFRKTALQYIRGHPGRTLQLFLKKFYYFWWFSPQSGFYYPSQWLVLYKAWYGGILLLGLIGMWGGRESGSNAQKEMCNLLVLFLFSIAFFQSIFFVEGRHRWAVEPVLLIFSAEGARLVIERVRTLCVGSAAKSA